MDTVIRGQVKIKKVRVSDFLFEIGYEICPCVKKCVGGDTFTLTSICVTLQI